jgi:DNA helicase-4
MVIVLDAVVRSYPLIHPDWIFMRLFGDTPGKIVQEEQRLLYVALTRAIETLVIITDGRSKSPYLEELEPRQPLSAVNWTDRPPVPDFTSRVIVKVGNQHGRGSDPTFAIKHLLKATQYTWQSRGWSGWAKTFPADGFNPEILKSEVWSQTADGIEVRIFSESDTLVAQFFIDRGNWTCALNQLDTIRAEQ